MSTTRPDHARGFAIISAIFILVVLAALASFVVSLTTSQSLTFAQDVQGTRAYQAARAGIEYGLARWLRATPSSPADCADITTAVDMPALGFSWVLDTTYASSGGVAFCEMVATARPTGMTSANVGSVGFIEREIRVIAEGNP